MLPPLSSRSIDPRLTAAGGVLRDAVGAIHNLQHLLGSTRVGPKALAQVIPDVRAACRPATTAVAELVAAAQEERPRESVEALGELVTTRMLELEHALSAAKRLTAAERLGLEQAVLHAVRDLDGALELVDLLVEASATSGVSLDAADVIRESRARTDTGSGRGRKVKVVVVPHGAPAPIRANPRVAVRLFGFLVARVARKEGGVRASVAPTPGGCRLDVVAQQDDGSGFAILVPPLISLTERFVEDIARGIGAEVSLGDGGRATSITFPPATPE